MTPPLTALFLCRGSFCVLLSATVAYVGFSRLETRFTLVVTFLLVFVLLTLAPVVFLQSRLEHGLSHAAGRRAPQRGETQTEGSSCSSLPARVSPVKKPAWDPISSSWCSGKSRQILMGDCMTRLKVGQQRTLRESCGGWSLTILFPHMLRSEVMRCSAPTLGSPQRDAFAAPRR